MKGDLKISENTVVHCPTEELANQVLKIAHNLGYKWRSGESFINNDYWYDSKEDTCFCIHLGQVDSLEWWKDEGHDVIPAEEFIKLHTMNKKVYYRGDPKRGREIIKALEKLGGVNIYSCDGGYHDILYYIKNNNNIGSCHENSDYAWLLKQCFTEEFLPEIPIETIEIDGILYDKKEFEEAVKGLKPMK